MFDKATLLALQKKVFDQQDRLFPEELTHPGPNKSAWVKTGIWFDERGVHLVMNPASMQHGFKDRVISKVELAMDWGEIRSFVEEVSDR